MNIYQKQWTAYDYSLRFEWNEASLEQAIQSIILPDWKEVPVAQADTVFQLQSDGANFSLKHNGEETGPKLSLSVLETTLKRVCHIDLATFAPEIVFVHAGVVLSKDGLIVLPGRSYAGKSTLVKSLVDLGARYYSDEYAAIGRDGRVAAFPRALCQRQLGGANGYWQATDLGWHESLGPEPIAKLVLTRYEQDGLWEPQPLSPGEAVLRMLENTVSARTNPQRALSFLAQAVQGAHCIESTRGESDLTAKLILQSI